MILSEWAQNRQQTNEQLNSFFMNYIIYDIIVGNRKRIQSLDSRPNLVLDFSRTIARDQIPDPLKCWLFVLFARMCWSRNKGRRFRDSVAPLVPMSTMSRGRSPTKSILNSKKSTTSWVRNFSVLRGIAWADTVLNNQACVAYVGEWLIIRGW